MHVKSASFTSNNGRISKLSIFTVFLTIETTSQNISITQLQMSLKFHEHIGGSSARERFWKNFPIVEKYCCK